MYGNRNESDMTPEQFITSKAIEAVKNIYGAETDASMLQVQVTRKEFEGDYTLVVFPLVRLSRKSPEVTGNEIGEWLKANVPEVEACNTVKGFLNISFSASYWNGLFMEMASDSDYGQLPPSGKTIMVEFSSPNTSSHTFRKLWTS